MSLWGAMVKAKREGREIRLEVCRSPGFPSKDYHETHQGNLTTFRTAGLNLTPEEESLAWHYFENWQHYHLSQPECQDWFYRYFRVRETISYHPVICTGKLNHHYFLGKNTVLGTRVLSMDDTGEVIG